MEQPAETVHQAASPDEMRHKVIDCIRDKRKALPTLPVIIQKLIKLAGDERTTVSELAAFISKDQAIANKVLRIANSSYYGMSRGIDSVARAINLVGFEEIVGLAVGVGVIPLLGGKESAKVLDIQALWRHSLGCSFAARLLENRACRNFPARQRDENPIFLIALLHDIGKVLFALYFPEVYQEIIALATEGDRNLVEAERERFGLDHAGIAILFQEFWNLPDNLVIPISYHHSPLDCPVAFRQDALLVCLADHLTKTAGIGWSVNTGKMDISVFQRELDCSPEEIAQYAAELAEKGREIDDFFTIVSK